MCGWLVEGMRKKEGIGVAGELPAFFLGIFRADQRRKLAAVGCEPICV